MWGLDDMGSQSARRFFRVVAGLCAAAVFAGSGVGGAAAAPADESTDIAPGELRQAKPGTVFRIWPLEGGVRPGYKGYRILYRSVGLKDEPLAVSGAILFPADTSGASRPIVAWAHPTTGVVTRCAPTLMPNLSTSIQGLDYFADAGYVIVATDYAGLGGPGTHPYLIGTNAARTLLDSVRAARTISDARAGDRFVVWGHSQGGHAALFTGQEASGYAPELKLLGVAAAAPATRLVELFDADRNTSSGRSLTAMALYSWSRTFDFALSDYVSPHAEPSFGRLANDCIEDVADFLKEDDDERALDRTFLKADPTADPRLRSIMEQNSAGLLPAGMPVFLAQGSADDLVRPAITHGYAKQLCSAGAKVKMHVMSGVSHTWAARDSAFAASQWIDALFKWRAPPSDCE